MIHPGSIPAELGRLKNLQDLVLRGNALTGERHVQGCVAVILACSACSKMVGLLDRRDECVDIDLRDDTGRVRDASYGKWNHAGMRRRKENQHASPDDHPVSV